MCVHAACWVACTMNRGFRGGDASAEPVAVLQAAIQQLAQRDQQAQEAAAPAERVAPEVPQFVPADYFQGARQGYYFGTGHHGTGYVRLCSYSACLFTLNVTSCASYEGVVVVVVVPAAVIMPPASSTAAVSFNGHPACCTAMPVSRYYRDAQQELDADAGAVRPQHDPQELLRLAEEEAAAAEVGGGE